MLTVKCSVMYPWTHRLPFISAYSDKNQKVHMIKVGLCYIVPTLLNCAISIHTRGKHGLITPQIFCSIPWYLIYLFNLQLQQLDSILLGSFFRRPTIYLVEVWQTAFPSIEDTCSNSVTRFLPIYHCWKVGYFAWTQYQKNQQTW